MDREKLFKKEMNNNIIRNKMSDNNKMVCFRDIQNFAGATLESCPPFKLDYDKVKSDIFNKDKKNYFYEWVTHDSKVKPYYDIDAFFVPKDKFIKHKKIDGIFENEDHKEKLSNDILEKAKKEISKVFDKGELIISSSCGDKNNTWSVKGNKTKFSGYAVSYHIVVAGYECNVGQLEKFNEIAGLDKLTGYDKSVYSDGQNFRVLYSSKPNDKRIKNPINYAGTPAIHLLHSTEFTNVSYLELPKIKNSPPSSPPQSPKKEVVEEVVENPVQEEEEGVAMPDTGAFVFNSITSYFSTLETTNSIINFNLGLSKVLGAFVNFVPSSFVNNLAQDGFLTYMPSLVNSGVAGGGEPAGAVGGTLANLETISFLRNGERFPQSYEISSVYKDSNNETSVVDPQVIKNFLGAIIPEKHHIRTSASPLTCNRNFTVSNNTGTGYRNMPDTGAIYGVGQLYDMLDSEGVDFSQAQFSIQMTNQLTDGNPISAYLFIKSKVVVAYSSDKGVQVLM